jgi:hypothetical protein
MKRKDPNQEPVDLVAAVTGQRKAKGAALVRVPKLKKLFKDATKKEAARKRKKP